MIFVYPAIVSETVDSKIGTAVCKVLEQFYLLHIQEAFQNNELRVKSVWDPKKEVYGPLVLEKDNNITGNILMELKGKTPDGIEYDIPDEHNSGFFPFEGEGKEDQPDPRKHSESSEIISKITHLETNYKTEYSKIPKEILTGSLSNKTSDELNSMLGDINGYILSIRNIKIEAEDLLNNEAEPELSRLNKKTDQYYGLAAYISQLKKLIHSINDLVNNLQSRRDDISKGSHSGSKEAAAWSKEKREREKEEREKALQYETHGMYKVEIMKGVSIKPSMANIQVRIHYQGAHKWYGSNISPHGEVGISPSQQYQEISVGVKLLPLRLSNFENLESVILDDYFTTKLQSVWKSYSRGFFRIVFPKIKKWTLGLIDINKIKNPLQVDTVLAPKGYDAAAFNKKSGTPSFYRFTSAIVVFNKSDLVKEEGTNFFLNREQLLKMFKMGWNAFCVLDPVKEEAIFISSLDGGYMHIIPYSYIFNSLSMDQVYQNMNDLQKRTPIFRMHKGNFASFVSRMKRESKLLKMFKPLNEGG